MTRRSIRRSAPYGAVAALMLASCYGTTEQTPPPTPDTGVVETPDTGVVTPPPPVDCNNYTYRGQTYNCGALDRCTEQNFAYRLACCECNPVLCDPDPSCVVTPPDAGFPPGVDAGTPPPPPAVESCMGCHNGATTANDYSGPGLSNPHPFGTAITCTGCHGGDGATPSKLLAHVPPPPQIGDRLKQQQDPAAYWNRLTLSGVDKLPDYTANGKTYTAIDWLNFVNPGDLRVTNVKRGCGAQNCHTTHSDWVNRGSPIATEIGFFSSAMFHIGVENAVTENRGLYNNTAADYTFRAQTDPTFTPGPSNEVGRIGRTLEVPEYAQFNGEFYNNLEYTAADLANDQYVAGVDPPEKVGRVKTGSALHKAYQEQISITCGDCHAGSAGANNRYADFRSSGCTACHMEYSYDGRSRSTDPNVNKLEPANPDAIAAPERPHIETHQIRNVAKILPNGAFLRGISDRACVGCHQGSNRTVLQYWGIRLDQNADLATNQQYPANPVTFTNTAQDPRLYDPAVQNNTFNGRNANQYILTEDYDGDGRDDTPEDVHYEAGLGCIDCHGSRDLHSGTDGDPESGQIKSRMDQVVQVGCESCHGGIDTYASTKPCTTYAGQNANCVYDRAGNPMRNVHKDPTGDYWLVSRVTGQRHYVPQTKDTVYNNNKRNPLNQQLVYNAKASYAMGRVDGTLDNGTGPQQTDPRLVANGFSHTDNMDCISCHASWTNNCTGCHLRTQYDANPANYFFSNITGERILLKQANADFTYISPVPMYLGVNSHNKVTQFAAGMKIFYRYTDLNGQDSQVFAFSDRNGNGNNPNYLGSNAKPALGHYQMMAHSIRGKVTATKEGPRYCVACHNTNDGIAQFGAQYAQFLETYNARDYANLDFNLLKQHVGQNPSNQLNSPIFVHGTAGLGTGLYLFDATGCPVNPLDPRADRFFCPNGAPANNFNANNVVYDLDRLVELTGVTNSCSLHPMQELGSALRAGALNPQMSGTLGAPLLNKLVNTDLNQGGKVLDSWIDANGNAQGNAANYIQ
ncbi:cytochrome c3 family protein [Myxococcota bacterium]|nr:cytochrome c3 family protein [Myxococcota bacterium]